MARANNYLAWQSRLILPELGQRVVEVGSGAGNFTGKLLDRQIVVALDLEPECIERLRRRYPGQPNLHSFVCDPTSASFADLAKFQPDSCVCTNVLEHIEDHRRALAAMAEILAPQGKIVLWVPAFQRLFGPMDRQLGHFRRYRRADIVRLASLTGLRLQKMHYVNSIGFFLWWASSHLIRQRHVTENQIGIFDRLVPPWLSRLESLAPPPFGQSLFAVLQKP
jgi:SAM-dependent methyltransferase